MGASITVPLYPGYQPRLRDGPVFSVDGKPVQQLEYLDWKNTKQTLGSIDEEVRIQVRPPDIGIFHARGTDRWQIVLTPQSKQFTLLQLDQSDKVVYSAVHKEIDLLQADGYAHRLTFYTLPPPPPPKINPIDLIRGQGLLSVSPWSAQDLGFIFILLVFLILLLGTGVTTISNISHDLPTSETNFRK